LWLVDFSRGFRTHNTLREPKNLTNTRLDRRFYDGLRGLSKETLQKEMGDVLRENEIAALLARRDKIVQYFEEQIAKKGEQAVICNTPGH
jgi:hypothetical protein